MSLFPKIVLSILTLLLLAVTVIAVSTYNTYSELRTNRDDQYQARMHYLPSPVPDTEFVMPGFNGWMKEKLHNKLIDKGPYVVAYPLLNEPPRKAIMILPGGGYTFRSEHKEGVEIAEWLNQNGIAAFVLNYRLQRHPVPLSDAQAGIRYLRSRSDEFNIRPDMIGIMGFSAGGHLAATASNLFTADSRPDFTVLAYPVIHVAGVLSHEGSALSLIGPNPSSDLVELLSPQRQVSHHTPPAFIWAPKTDTVVPWQNSLNYADALDTSEIANELHIFPEGSHGSALAQHEEYANAWPSLMLTWLDKL